jgi:signal transduction histidine kinase
LAENLKFRVSSELKTLIGKELITDDFVAIFELVKNSYDAYAKQVVITFQNTSDLNGTKIFIQDNGKGMSRSDIEKKWLFVGYSEKRGFEAELKGKDFRDFIAKQRVLAGAKGIGRFSCDKLGSKLRLFSKQQDDKYTHLLEVDWKKFEQQPTNEFQTIEVPYREITELDIGVPTKNFKQGTILEISSLRSPWDRDKILELKRHLQRLINPLQMSVEFSIILIAKEYKTDDEKNRSKGDFAIVNGPVTNIVLEKLDLKTTNISCVIDNEGHHVKTELYDKGLFIFSVNEENPYPQLHNLAVKIFYLDPVAKASFKRLMGVESKNYGSIFLYKNGIRINPYGNKGDDWLGLDTRKTQGTRRFFGTREVLGRIEVNGAQSGFVEVSSRDGGVVKSAELDCLKVFFFEKPLRRLERYVVEGVGWSEESPKDPEEVKTDTLVLLSKIIGHPADGKTQIKFNEQLLQIYRQKEIEKTPIIIKNLTVLKKFLPKDEQEFVDKQIASLQASFKILQDEREEAQKQLEVATIQNIFLKKISDEEKQDIISLQHHIKISTGTMIQHLMKLKETAESPNQISKEEILKIIDDILVQTTLIQSIVLYVTKASFEVKVARITKDMIEFVKQYIDNVHSEKVIIGPKVSVVVSPEKSLFVNKFRPLDLIMIIDNLIDNSEKAHARNVQISLKKLDESNLEICVRDDGRGIDKDNLERLFEFGFSTTNGSGIGLYSIKKIVEQNNGWSIRVNEKISKGAEFILGVRKYGTFI